MNNNDKKKENHTSANIYNNENSYAENDINKDNADGNDNNKNKDKLQNITTVTIKMS